MSSASGKRVAILTAALALAVLVAAGFVVWPSLVEEYHLRRLSSDEESTRVDAAVALGRMKSVRSVPMMIRLATADREERFWKLGIDGDGSSIFAFTPILHALYVIGPEALPGLRKAQVTIEPERIAGVIAAIEAPDDRVVMDVTDVELRRVLDSY